MRIGVMTHATDHTIEPAKLAAASNGGPFAGVPFAVVSPAGPGAASHRRTINPLSLHGHRSIS